MFTFSLYNLGPLTWIISSLSLGETERPQMSSPWKVGMIVLRMTNKYSLLNKDKGNNHRVYGIIPNWQQRWPKRTYLSQGAFELLPNSSQEKLLPNIWGVVFPALEPPGAALLHVRIFPQRLPEGGNLLPFSSTVGNPVTSPPSWDDSRSGWGVVWRQGCGCKRSRTPFTWFIMTIRSKMEVVKPAQCWQYKLSSGWLGTQQRWSLCLPVCAFVQNWPMKTFPGAYLVNPESPGSVEGDPFTVRGAESLKGKMMEGENFRNNQ